MQPLIQFLALPLIFIALIWLVKNTQFITLLASLLFWAQTALLTYFLFPVLSGRSQTFIPFDDFSVNHLAALFVMLTQVIVASSMTHAHIFFQHDGPYFDDCLQLRIFYTCTTLLSIAMTSVFFCNNLGFLWISVETTTLCSAPLIYFHRTKHSLEAAWKYLIVCSVGIAFALFGTMFIFASGQYGALPHGSLNVDELILHANMLQYPLLKLGFLFCFLGYGTKAGIFPLHGWLPDAYSEAPAPASAFLSGGLLNCTLFAIWRISEIVAAAGHHELVQKIAVNAGVATVLFASLFLIRQHGIKRMFAYSSIENVGLMITAIGLGSGFLFFVLSLNTSVAKVALFLVSGNIVQATGTKELSQIRGLVTINPYWATILALGAFAVTGAPPFGSFISEWKLLVNISKLNLWPALILMSLSLALSFLSITMHVGKMVCGTPHEQTMLLPPLRSSLIPAALILLTLLCGVTTMLSLLGDL